MFGSVSIRRFLLGIFLTASPCILAQENATITGTVTDPSDAVVANAEITLTSQATGLIRKSSTDSSGSYTFVNVGVGRFTLDATLQGFQKLTKTDIIVNTATTIRQDFKLSVGSETQSVTVEADALQLQSETSEVSNLISGAQVTQLATNGRNVVSLAALGMGVSNTLPAFGGVNALTSANGISFNGTRSSHNVYLLDGGELNDRGCGGCFSSLPSVDALAQFQTLDSNYGPDYGIGSGGTILMVLRSGTNRFHGSLWEFNRNEAYAANNYFTNLAGQPRPKFRLNNFGGNFGGPLFIPHIYNNARNRTFFFVNEEWRKLNQGSAPATVNTIAANNFATLNQDLVYTVPTNGTVPIVPATTDPARLAIYAGRGLTPGSPFPSGGTPNTVLIPRELMDQNAVRELNAGTFPKPNFGTSQYISSIPQPTNVREDVVRIDHTISTKLQLMGHYLHDAVDQTYYPPLWGNSSFPTVGTAMKNPSWSATIKLAQTLTPNLLNETGFLFSGNTINLDPVGNYQQPSSWNATTFFPPANNFLSRLPEIQLGAPYSVNWSPSYFPWKNSYMGYQTRDDLSWNKGKHQLKFGFAWLHAVKNQQLQANTQGTAVFNNNTFSKDPYINFLLGTTASFTQLEYLAGKHWVNNNYSFYANDNWRVIPGLTLNIGLRYDGMPHAFERYNQFANFVPGLYDRSLPNPFNTDGSGTLNPASLTNFNGRPFYLNGIRAAGVNGFPRGNVQDRFYTFQPRIGFAYTPPGMSNTVIRGGFGLFWERVQGNDVYNAALNPPFAFQPSANNVYFSNPNQSADTGAITSQRFPSAMTTLQYDYSPPGTAQFSLGVQRQVATSTIAVIQYVGSLGWSQSNNRAINTLPLNDLTNRQAVAGGKAANSYRIFPGFSSITQEENQSNFNYHSLQAGMRMENRHGLTFQLAYTYSHEIDVVTNDLGMVSNPFSLAYDRGSGAFDRRHIFTANYIYELPFFRNSGNALQRSVLGGWDFSGITVAQTGAPQPISYNGPDVLGLGGGTTNRPNLVAPITYPKTRLAWFNKGAFAAPLAPWAGGNGFGNAGKDVVRLPGLLNFNLALFKTFTFTEAMRLQLRLETFNTFNHTQFNAINSNTNDGNFGQITSARDARTVQLGGKFSF